MKGDKKANSKGGFGWRHGSERFTTGIWIWDEWFERTVPSTGEKASCFGIYRSSNQKNKVTRMITSNILLYTLLESFFC